MMDDLETKFEQITQKLSADLGLIRTGRATASLVEDLPVVAYGAPMKLKELASITIPEPRQILISPWDQTTLVEIEKVLRIKGFNPTVEGNTLRIALPSLTGEEREKLLREVSGKAEEAKVATRLARRETVEKVEEEEKNKEISKDESFTQKKEIDQLLEEYNRRINELAKEKSEQLVI